MAHSQSTARCLAGLAMATACVISSTSFAQAPRGGGMNRLHGTPPQELGATGARPLAPSGASSPSAPQQSTAIAAQAFQKTKTAKSVDDYTEILTLCEQALVHERDPAVRKYCQQLTAWAANRRGEAYSQEAARHTEAGETDAALQYDQQALVDFNTAVINDPTKWKSLHNRGVGLALVARYEEALDDLTKAIELKSDYVNTWFNRAEVRYELGQYADAVGDYSEVIQRQPDDVGAFTGRGHAHFRMGEFDKALADYQRAVTLDPTSSGALVNRGDTYRHLSQFAKAAADYRQAVKLDESNGRAYRAAAWLMATCPDEKLRNPDLALQAAAKAIELDGSEDYLYLDTLAAAYANAGKYSEAVETVEQALQAAPEEATLPLQERLTHYQAGKPFRLPGTQIASQLTPAKRE